MSDSVLVALITAVPATITALAMWRQSSARTSPSRTETEPPSPPHTAAPPGQRWATFLVGAIVTVAVLFLAPQVLPDDDRRDDVFETVTVPGTARFTDAGIDLDRGDMVTVTATGEVFHSVELGHKAGPDGDPGKRFASNVVPTSDHGSLIGRIGDGRPFQVGVHTTFTVDRDGAFFLGINDTGVANNSGSFRADIEVRRRR